MPRPANRCGTAGALLSTPEDAPGAGARLTRPVLGIDIGGTGLKVGIVVVPAGPGGTPALLGTDVLAGHADKDPLAALDRLKRAAGHLLSACGVEPEAIAAIGVGCAGLVDQENGMLRTSPNLPTWRDVPLRAELEARFRRPVHLANDAAAFVEAEWRFGAARGAATALFVTLGTGVGGGLVLDGRPFRGAGGLGAEIGHMSIDVNGPPCPCGNRGCLELFVGRAAIERAAKDAGFADDAISPARVAERAYAGDERAMRIFDRIGGFLGAALAGAVNLLDPQVIVIGGGIAASADLLLPAAEREIMARSMVARQGKVRLESSHFGPGAGMIGAALLAVPVLEN